MKYILVTGGVISGIGKGVIASSVGAILKCCGMRVTAIKIDPYINIDAGTFSPYEHGKAEVVKEFTYSILTVQSTITTYNLYCTVMHCHSRLSFLLNV